MKHVLVLADMHINLTTGLSLPLVELDDGGKYHASKNQKWLFHKFNEILDRVNAIVKDDELITIVNGDSAETDLKNRSHQLISRNKADIQNTRLNFWNPFASGPAS